jgi:hypothetical protein
LKTALMKAAPFNLSRWWSGRSAGTIGVAHMGRRRGRGVDAMSASAQARRKQLVLAAPYLLPSLVPF